MSLQPLRGDCYCHSDGVHPDDVIVDQLGWDSSRMRVALVVAAPLPCLGKTRRSALTLLRWLFALAILVCLAVDVYDWGVSVAVYVLSEVRFWGWQLWERPRWAFQRTSSGTILFVTACGVHHAFRIIETHGIWFNLPFSFSECLPGEIRVLWCMQQFNSEVTRLKKKIAFRSLLAARHGKGRYFK